MGRAAGLGGVAARAREHGPSLFTLHLCQRPDNSDAWASPNQERMKTQETIVPGTTGTLGESLFTQKPKYVWVYPPSSKPLPFSKYLCSQAVVDIPLPTHHAWEKVVSYYTRFKLTILTLSISLGFL